ncbi:MAG: hypothetical protein WB764_14370 [Xanthobacteraceae bacterium]
MPESKLLLDQPATVTWIEGMKTSVGGKLLPDSRSRDFSSVRDAVKFIMESLTADRDHAEIKTGEITLYPLDIRAMYAKLKET